VAVIVEHGGGGGSVAAPTAAKIFAAALGSEPRSRPPTVSGG
jgi:cell division protein FtsI/penicillin-binding protein 2